MIDASLSLKLLKLSITSKLYVILINDDCGVFLTLSAPDRLTEGTVLSDYIKEIYISLPVDQKM